MTTDTVLTAEAPAATADNVDSAVVADKPADAAPADAAPVVADYEFTLPDEFDATQLNADEIKAFAKDLGLDPVADKERVQKIVDRVVKQRADFEATSASTVAEVHASWAEQAKADKEIGGDKFDATLAAARSLIDNPKFVTPEFKTFLNETGLGNHPEAIRVFARLAPHFANDTPVPGGGGAPSGDPLKGLYSASDHI
jgi:hypothetical protein